jgi:hypothetical protein
VKDAQQIEIFAERLGSFHGEKKRDSSFLLSLFNLGKGPAKHEARHRCQLRFEQRHLIERHAQRWLTQVLVLHIQRDAEQTDVAGLELGQEIRRNDVPAWAAEKKNERQIEVQIDQPASAALQLAPVRFCGHGVTRPLKPFN